MVGMDADAVHHQDAGPSPAVFGMQPEKLVPPLPLQPDGLPDHEARHHLLGPAPFARMVLRQRRQRRSEQENGQQVADHLQVSAVPQRNTAEARPP